MLDLKASQIQYLDIYHHVRELLSNLATLFLGFLWLRIFYICPVYIRCVNLIGLYTWQLTYHSHTGPLWSDNAIMARHGVCSGWPHWCRLDEVFVFHCVQPQAQHFICKTDRITLLTIHLLWSCFSATQQEAYPSFNFVVTHSTVFVCHLNLPRRKDLTTMNTTLTGWCKSHIAQMEHYMHLLI
jgi:hypothetical protein